MNYNKFFSSIILITSKNENNTNFGSGFIFERDNDYEYILTCDHVIEDVGGNISVNIFGCEIISIVSGSSNNLDIAIIKVRGLRNRNIIPIGVLSNGKSPSCCVLGHHSAGKQILLRAVECKVTGEFLSALRNDGKQYKGIDIVIEGDNLLQKGYSGSPLISLSNGGVIGVVSHSVSEGKKGWAINIESLRSMDLALLGNDTKIFSFDAIKEQIPISDETSVNEHNPLLIGALIDVSSAMRHNLKGTRRRSRVSSNDIEDALDELVGNIVNYCRTSQGEEVLPKISLFAYGYGFGNKYRSIANIVYRMKISAINPDSVPSGSVRDILKISDDSSSTLTAYDLSTDWNKYKRYLSEHMYDTALGEPLLYEGLNFVLDRVIRELRQPYYESPIVFLISSGILDKNNIESVFGVIESLKSLGVQIVSCYIGSKNIVRPKTLYTSPDADWPKEALLLFHFASSISLMNDQAREISQIARDSGWYMPNDAKLFIQANHTVMFREFVKLLIDSHK